MYCVPVKAADRGQLTEDEIASQLLYLLSDAPCLPSKPAPVGLLTAEPRSLWARDRQVLLQDEPNRHIIELIEQALCLVCLDESLPTTFNANGFIGATAAGHMSGGRDESNMAHQMIHGGGSECNSANRWFDKTMQVSEQRWISFFLFDDNGDNDCEQIIICNDGTWGLCYEHSTSEGIAVVLLLEQILNKIDNMVPPEDGVPLQHLPPPERLEWIIQPEIAKRLTEAAVSFDKRIEDLDFYVYRYRNYGKNFIKSCQVSPDVYIQLALQLAYFKWVFSSGQIFVEKTYSDYRPTDCTVI